MTDISKDGGGLRFNQDKLPYSLLPLLPLEEVIRVFGYGAKKYPKWNWYRGMKYGVSYDSGQRHRAKWWMGETNDPESGLHHLAHSIVNDLFNLTFELEKRADLDDRVRFNIPEPVK
jgi:hypothetical protein